MKTKQRSAGTAAHALEELREKSERLRLALAANGMGTWEMDLVNNRRIWSDETLAMHSLTRDEVGDGHVELTDAIMHPADRARLAELHAELRGGRDSYHFEYRTTCHGEERWIEARGTVFARAAAGPTRIVGVTADITARKEWEARQLLMNRELAHRVKNSFAVLQAILRSTLKASPDPADFASAFSGRLHSLAAAHDILSASDWRGAELGALARHLLSFYIGPGNEQVAIRGPPVNLAAEQAAPFALIFNELATNALKYGALSAPAGKIGLSWTIEPSVNGDSKLRLVWRESDGPKVAPAVRRGFGSTLIERSLPGASIDSAFRPEGLVCTIEILHASPAAP